MKTIVEHTIQQSKLSRVPDFERLRADFPVLTQHVHGVPLAYLDNAATTQKPALVIEETGRYYREYNANPHRGVHALAELATEAYEVAREKVRAFINADHHKNIVFTRGTTEAINLVASCFGRAFLKEGDEIILSQMEHHSNIVPWQLACEYYGAVLRVVPISDTGEFCFDTYEKLFNLRTKIVALTHVSNALGTITPIQHIIAHAHASGVPVLVDGAQAVAHSPVDVQALDCDFYVFSGHKIFAPTGIGVLYGKSEWLERLPPYQGGGSMIRAVSFEKTDYADPPHKFEAGTPHVAGAIGLGVALDYVKRIGLEAIAKHETELLSEATDAALKIDGLRIIGTAKEKAGILSFVIEGLHPHDIATILDHNGVAVRAGHHCAMPVMQRFKIPATTRASFAFYNNRADVAAFINALHQAQELFGKRNNV
ncbi:MAG: cysteine desulfurase [Spirochaetia bacterium]|jgi:cysteine desulfurase/selenocysteine lyase|nr:cysteine desulfurase [Spirochaetia bacterium]